MVMVEPSLPFRQPPRGYRFSVDSLILAAYLCDGDFDGRGLEVGCGVGVVSLLVGAFGRQQELLGLELQPELLAYAQENLKENAAFLRCPVRFQRSDARAFRSAERFDLLFANPPFFRAGTGHRSPDPVTALARHDDALSPADLASLAARLLAPGGAGVFVYPMARRDEVVHCLGAAGLEVARLTAVRSFDGDRPYLALIEAGHAAARGPAAWGEVVTLFDGPNLYRPWLEPWVRRIRKPRP
jgi:tRNA1Val (adenine37-N6)-methyltransferase